MSRSRAERVERVERERLSGRRRVNVARVITPLPLPRSPPFSSSLFLSRGPRGLSPCHSRSSLALPLYLSAYPSLLRSPPPCRNPSLALVSAPRSLAYDTTRWPPFSLSLGSLARSSRLVSSRLTSRLPLGAGYSTRPLRALSADVFLLPLPHCARTVYRCKPLSISRAWGC